MSSSIENIVKALGAKRFGDHNAQIDWILTDSRSLCFPEETLFFALKTKRNDGHKYIPDLYERGVRNFVVSELPENKEAYTAANFLQLANPLQMWKPDTILCLSWQQGILQMNLKNFEITPFPFQYGNDNVVHAYFTLY